MLLKELLKDIPVLECTADQEDEITAICYDSRKAEPGCLFVAVSGFAACQQRLSAAAAPSSSAPGSSVHSTVPCQPFSAYRLSAPRRWRRTRHATFQKTPRTPRTAQ